MSNEYMLKDIEKLKQANTFLKALFADIENYKTKEGISYPVGIPHFGYRDEYQVNYNEMCIDILSHFIEKLGDKEELTIGKYLTCWLGMCDARIRIGFSLNKEVEAKLYDEVFGSWSTIYEWSKKTILPLLSLITVKHIDFEDVFYFFEHVGTDTSSGERCLVWEISTYAKAEIEAKKVIDDIFELSEDEEVLKDIDEVLDTYLDKVFKYNKEEY